MKKEYFFSTILTLVFLSQSCDFSAKAISNTRECSDAISKIQPNQPSLVNQNGSAPNAVTEQKFATESIVVKKSGPENMSVNFSATIDFPVQGPDFLTNSAKRKILESLDGKSHTTLNKEEVEKMAQEYVDHSVAELKEMEERSLAYTFDAKIKVVDNTASYLTYNVNKYTYTGGAHGMPENYHFTINKQNGKAMGWDDLIIPSKREELKAIVKDFLVDQYYNGEAPDWGEYFQYDLPASAPALTTSGLLFNYQAYEIDCYAAGMPQCYLPYDAVKDIMTKEALELVNHQF